MEDVKDRLRGFLKKANNTFSSSSSSSRKFKGQGRVLGSSSTSPSNPAPPHPDRPSPTSNSSSHLPKTQNPLPEATLIPHPDVPSARSPANPFHPSITSGRTSIDGSSPNSFECPICSSPFQSEEEITHHIDNCIQNSYAKSSPDKFNPDLEERIVVFLSGNPSETSVETVLRLLRNIVKDPVNEKFRRLRTSNPKIRESICEIAGGNELIECIGFKPLEEEGDKWLVMDLPKEEQVLLIKKAISLLEPATNKIKNPNLLPPVNKSAEPVEVDRQMRVFVSSSGNIASDMDLSDSFYNLSLGELKRESDMRKKKIEESKLLIPKSLKEKQGRAAKRRYGTTVIRIQFPDGVLLQGVFSPSEPTTAVYEFVSSALKQPCLEFELLHPVVVKRLAIPKSGEMDRTLEEEDLVPTALLKFKSFELDSLVYTGLRDDLLQISEPLKTDLSIPYS